jgi:predicted nucleic acid-binding protein
MDITIDTSAILAVCLNEPPTARLVSQSEGANLIAPSSINWEVGNALSAMLKRDRMDMAKALACLAAYREIPIKLVEVDLEQSLAIAGRFRMYAYDAYLLTCAIQYRTPLMSLDRPLQEAARQLGIEVLGGI